MGQGSKTSMWSCPTSLDYAIAGFYSTVIRCYKVFGIDSYFCMISNEPSAVMKVQSIDGRTVLWYIKIQGECCDTFIFDPLSQEGENIHQRGAGFMGFKTRRLAEEYLHWLFRWDAVNRRGADAPLKRDAQGSWKVWIFYIKRQGTLNEAYGAGRLLPQSLLPVPIDCKVVGPEKWMNVFTSEVTEIRPTQSRIHLVTNSWYEMITKDGNVIWRNSITKKTSFKEPTGPDPDSTMWSKHKDKKGKTFWYLFCHSQ